MNLKRTQILRGSYKYPDELIRIIPTNHFRKRLEERGIGLTCIPKMVRVTKDNIHSGKTFDGKNLISVVIRLKYSSSEWVFICLNPFDGAGKSLWFERRVERNNRQTI